ncbi:hypothetical protein [Pleurocapsa sp. PCC 7319]|uniref:hypothetical protein n=1 Tax=Pleurocapsa sp. PCC 7319 TaxID=118161 RepID=UPI00034997E9|nr:hypothetical protein [Pleurocapsa sp. PCC 7319]
MISAHRSITTLISTLLLVSCSSLPNITITIGSEPSKVESQPTTTDSSSISQSEESEAVELEDRSTRTDDSETIAQSKSSSTSPCPTTNITESNRISLLKLSEGGESVSCSGTICTGGATQIDVLDGVDEYLDDPLFAGKEVVYRFKDGKCAAFDTFSVMASQKMNLKDFEFELLVGNESPSGKFESIGEFTMDGQTNTQTFNFEPKVGQYFKVKKLTRENLDSSYTLQLWGALE